MGEKLGLWSEYQQAWVAKINRYHDYRENRLMIHSIEWTRDPDEALYLFAFADSHVKEINDFLRKCNWPRVFDDSFERVGATEHKQLHICNNV